MNTADTSVKKKRSKSGRPRLSAEPNKSRKEQRPNRAKAIKVITKAENRIKSHKKRNQLEETKSEPGAEAGTSRVKLNPIVKKPRAVLTNRAIAPLPPTE